jgi:hypothetical protein
VKPEDVNTINADGKAFSDNYGPLGVALIFVVLVAIIGISRLF